MFIFGLILVVVGLVALVAASALARRYKAAVASHEQKLAEYKASSKIYNREPEKPSAVAKLIALALGILLLLGGIGAALPQFFYSQETRESVQLKDWTGNLVGSTTDSGLHPKAPWVDPIFFSTGNQQIIFAGQSGNQSDNAGGTAAGPQITAQDREGVTSDIDLALRYSIKPGSVTEIYKQFKTEDNFKKSFIEQDIRAVVRTVPNKFSTIDLLTKRAEVEKAITDALVSRWAKQGVSIDSVSLQEIRPRGAVLKAYEDAQKAQIAVTQAQADLEKKKVEAQQTVQAAQAQADANEILNAHPLNEGALQQKYIDALKGGSVFVVPEGSTPMIQTGGQK